MILILAIHCLTFSQQNDSISLKPFKVEVVEKDTCFCWTLKQSKKIAKHIVKSEGYDSLSFYCDSILSHKDTIILRQKRLIDLKSSLIHDKENEIKLNDHINDNLIYKIRKNNRKRLFGAVIFSAFVGYILNE